MKFKINKNHLIGFIVLLLLLTSAYALYLANMEIQKKIIEKETSGMHISSINISENMRFFFGKYFGELSFLAELKDIQKLNATGKRLMKVFYEHNKNNISAITRITKKGIIKYTIPYVKTAIGKDVSGQKHNMEMLRFHQPIISDVFKAVQGYRTIAFAYPVFDENGNFDGELSLLLPFEKFANKYLDSLRINEDSRVFLTSANGVILFSHNKKEVGKLIFDKDIKKTIPDSILNKILKDGNGSLNYSFTSPSGSKGNYISIYTQVPLFKSHWTLIINTPVKSLLKTLHTYNIQFIYIVMSLGLGLLLFAFVFYRSRSKAHSKIIEQERFFLAVAKVTGQIIYEHNISTGKISWWGAIEKVTGYLPEEFQALDFETWVTKLCHPDEKKLHRFDKGTLKKLSNPLKREYRIRRKDGKFITVEDNGYFIFNNKGEAILQVGTISDITERKKAELFMLNYQQKLEEEVKERTEELNLANKSLSNEVEKRKIQEIELRQALRKAEAADKMKQFFLQTISHEIRTPLAAIVNNTDLLFELLDEGQKEKFLPYKYSIITSSRRIIRTIDTILIMAQFENDEYEQRLEKFSLSETLELICDDLNINAKKNGNKFTCKGTAPESSVYQDKFAIEQILKHVIENALEYTKEGNVNIVLSKKDSNEFIITVEDDGEGISEDYLPRIFEPFTQEKAGYTRKHEGSGMGLAVVKKLCETSKIEIDIKSKKGVGTKVTLIIKSFEK